MPRYRCLGPAIVAGFCAFGLVSFGASPLFGVFGVLLFALLAVSYSVMIDCGEAVWLPIAVGGGSLILHAVLYSTEPLDVLTSLTSLLFAFAGAVCLCVCARRKARKSVTFAAVCGVYTVLLLTTTALSACSVYGVHIDSFGKETRRLVNMVGETYDGLLAAALADRGMDSEMQSTLAMLVETVKESVLLSLPSLAVSYAMLLSVITLFFYRIVAKTAKMTELCLENRAWRFELSRVTIVFFYLCYAVYFISGLVEPGGLIYVTFMNLSMIFAYPFAYLGLRAMYSVVMLRVKSRAAAIVLIGLFLFIFAFVLGAAGILTTLLAFIGAASALARARADKPQL